MSVPVQGDKPASSARPSKNGEDEGTGNIGPYEMEKALEMVAMNERFINGIEGKTVIAFIGVTKSGKSTTIDSLLDPPLVEDEVLSKGGSIVFKTKSGKPFASEIGDGEEGLSCTKFPRAYPFPLDDHHVLLDTRGFYDTGSNAAEEVAAHILLEIALRKAKEVKMVFVIKANDFKDGFVGLTEVVDIVERIVNDGVDVPVLFLFVNYRTGTGKAERALSTLIGNSIDDELSYEERKTNMEQVNDRLKEIFSSTEKALTKGALDEDAKAKSFLDGKLESLRKRALTSLLAGEIEALNKNPQVVSARKKMKFSAFLHQNFERGNFMYFEPQSDASIEMLRTFISSPRLQALPRNNQFFNFERSHDCIRMFFNALRRKVQDEIPFLEAKTMVLQHPRHEVERIFKSVQASCEEHRKALRILSKAERDEKFLLAYREKYSEQVLNLKAKMIESEIEKIQKDIEDLRGQIKSVIDAEPVMYWDSGRWDEWGWYSFFHVKYPGDVPYVDVKEDLGDGTSEMGVVSRESPKFDVYYGVGSNWARYSNGAKYYIHVVPSFLGIEASKRKVDETYAEFKHNTGQVKIYVRKQDIPAEKVALERKTGEVKSLEQTLAKKRKEKHDFEESKLTPDLEKKAKHLLASAEEEERNWSTYLCFVDRFSGVSIHILEFVEALKQIIDKYFDETDLSKPKNERIREFIGKYNEFKSAKFSDEKVDVATLAGKCVRLEDVFVRSGILRPLPPSPPSQSK